QGGVTPAQVLAIVCLALSVRFYQNFSRPADQKASSYQERLPYSESLKDLDDGNSTTFAPNSRDTRDQGLPTLVFTAFWAACACIILILVASIAAICWGKRFCNLILIVLAILGVVAFLVFGILFVLTYKDRYPKRAVKLLMVFCFILAAVFLVDLIYCICIRGKHRT
ncbi:unnamed protein product, partial [Timema podura]|nr:unnamed protein product [Timema podura]